MWGCATPPAGSALRPGVPIETLMGRLSVRIDGQPERGVSAGFELTGNAEQGGLLLTGPLGTTAARASWWPGHAVLASAGTETDYLELDSLVTAALGEPIPMAALFDWLRGRAWPGAAANPRPDGTAGFEQLGWRINLARWPEGAIEAYRAAPPAITVRARLEPPA